MSVQSIIQLLGGVGLFLFAIKLISEALQLIAGDRLRQLIGTLTKTPIMGVLVGACVTVLIQSSSATTVMTVSFVDAGLMTLTQAIGVIMGANIGTTVTAQIIRLMDINSSGAAFIEIFKPSTLAPLAVLCGIIFLKFVKSQKTKGTGMMLMGFGILFTGLMGMTEAVSPLSESQAFTDVLQKFSDVPILGILTGLITTFIVQSSSAVIGMVQALSSTGAFTFQTVYPLIIGINLGTCITTAIVCSIGTDKDAKRTGIAHILFNCIGTVLFMAAIPLLHHAGALNFIWGKPMNSGGIANFTTIFNLVTALALLPFTNQLVKLTTLIVKDSPDDTEDFYPEMRTLDEKLFISPALALHQVNIAEASMGRLARKNFNRSIDQLVSYDPERSAKISSVEDRLDGFTDAAENYLIKLSNHIDSTEDNNELNLLLQAVTDFERIGDYATNINDLSARLVADGHAFSETAKRELEILSSALTEIIDLTVEAFANGDEAMARRIEPLEEVIDEMVATLKDRHIARLKNGSCTIGAGLVFIEVLTHMGRAADQCSSIAVFLLGRHNEEILSNHHAYLHELHKGNDAYYASEFEARRREFLDPIETL